MIPVPKEGLTTTTRPSSKSQGTRTASFFKEIPQLMPLREFSSAYQLVKNIVLQFEDSNSTTGSEVTTAPPGQLGKLTKDQNILQIVKRYRIPFLCRPKQKREPKERIFPVQEKETISLEVENLLKKGAVEQVRPQKDQFLSDVFIVKKKDGDSKSVNNLKELNQYIP